MIVLIPKLQLGNAGLEAPASSLAKLEFRLLVPKLELGNQKNLSLLPGNQNPVFYFY